MSKQLPADGEQSIITNGVTPTLDESRSGPMTVLVVDDDPSMADLTATYLERESDGFEAHKETSARDGLEYMGEVDAIVSDYDMPGMDGLEFLEAVRSDRPELPFILFTGRGDEEIASEAISNGVTDYLQKGSGSARYSVLANRLKNSIDRYWAEQNLRQSEKRFSRLVENSSDVITIVSESAQFKYVSPSASDILGYEPEALVGDPIFDYAHPNDRQEAMEEFFDAVENPDTEPVVRFRFKHPDGEWPVLESRGRNLLDDDVINGFVVNSRDISEITERESELEQQNQQLRNIKKTLSHDLSDPLAVAKSALEMYRETDDPEDLARVEQSLDSIDRLLDQILDFSDQGVREIDATSVSLRDVVTEAWTVTPSNGATLHLNESKQLDADPSHLTQLFENLFKNAVEHNESPVHITVGTVDGGFYVADDGDGLKPADSVDPFEAGYTTIPDNLGFGLAIVEQVVLSHGWEISLCESEEGGARFEITGVSYQPEVYE